MIHDERLFATWVGYRRGVVNSRSWRFLAAPPIPGPLVSRPRLGRQSLELLDNIRRMGRNARERREAKSAAKSPERIPFSTNSTGHSLINYLRGSGTIGLIMGVAAMLLTEFFWFATVLVYLGAIVFVVDFYFETTLSRIKKWGLSMTILLLVSAFTFQIVLFKADPFIKVSWSIANYPEGTNLSGITWRPGLSRLLVSFQNLTDRDFSGVDLTIQTNEAIVQIAQQTTIPCVQIDELVVTVTDSANLFSKLGSIEPRRFRCSEIPAKATVQFIVALANLDDLMKFMLDPKVTKGATINGFFGPKKKPQWVNVDATSLLSDRF